ncbi:hypothetical protein VaNZ11_008847 [Volvox africanus]|uniref:Uncharacterized protein n=1 Tax=Volvox africanus TaxID=51714 RepID=A0ABQ5S604_9CHLO|nr:hypothetical protein VaNZ11_008847 [Volvox africanus]
MLKAVASSWITLWPVFTIIHFVERRIPHTVPSWPSATAGSTINRNDQASMSSSPADPLPRSPPATHRVLELAVNGAVLVALEAPSGDAMEGVGAVVLRMLPIRDSTSNPKCARILPAASAWVGLVARCGGVGWRGRGDGGHILERAWNTRGPFLSGEAPPGWRVLSA